jgi:aldose 1-epimerase
MAQVQELLPSVSLVVTSDTPKSKSIIRSFSLSLNGVTVEISSVGGSITKILLPHGVTGDTDDIALGYKSPLEMHSSGNPCFLGVIVGRVANRIARGQFQLDNELIYDKLAINNSPNHLHGGNQGFSRHIWDMHVVDVPIEHGNNSTSSTCTTKGVCCTLVSLDGDEGYPGSVAVSATYTLLQHNDDEKSVTLRLQMKAQLQDNKPTPINLAQHTYFNLGGHANPQGILEHRVTLACDKYTPNDATSIPTRAVVPVKNEPAMDLTAGKLMKDAIQDFAIAKAGLTVDEASRHLKTTSRVGPNVAISGKECLTPGLPYGFDHNYVVSRSTTSNNDNTRDDGSLHLVGTIEHEPSKRRMTVFTSAPGVQLYTGNFLDGFHPAPDICKDGATYGQWQGMCLETQHFPDSIMSPEEEVKFPEFAKGKCPILRPGGNDYEHTVEYRFDQME